jgi:type I protein arginine methyltransferase
MNYSDDIDDEFIDWSDEEEELPVKSLFDDMYFKDPIMYRQHHIDVYSFDLNDLTRRVKHDYESLIQLVNFIRWETFLLLSQCDKTVSPEFINGLLSRIEDEVYIGVERNMMPALPGDPLLMNPKRFLMDKSITTPLININEVDSDNDDSDRDDGLVKEHEVILDPLTLQEELKRYKELVTALTIDDDCHSIASSDDEQECVSGYFASYGSIAIHETMLRDDSRTQAYCDAITSSVVIDKTVMDVGCGTGILSLFAVRAGAARVIGIDNSQIIEVARKIVERNNYKDIIHLVRGTVEELEIPILNGEQVDIIVSEWYARILCEHKSLFYI